MLTEERKNYILEQIKLYGIVRNTELTELLKTSKTTIRRDLQELEDEGLLQRIHGGARSLHSLIQEDSFSEKTTKNTQNKQQIGEIAAEQVISGDTIFLDAGTSTYAMIPFLKEKNIQVVTNSIYHANYLVDLQIPTMILGGTIKENTKAIVGLSTYSQLQTMQFDKAFIGTNGIDLTSGFTTPDHEEATLKQLAIQQARLTFFLADHSKFNQVFFAQISKTNEKHTLITDSCPNDYRKKLANYQIMEVSK